MHIQPNDVLLVVDVQRDFLPGGTLAVPEGETIVGPVNHLGRMFQHVILTQDWHPVGHVSFAATHPGRSEFDVIEVAYGRQVLWPVHCVQGSDGATLAPGLDLPAAELVVRKGFRTAVDSYSAFHEADRTTPTGLNGYLRERGLDRVFLAGLATDFCVCWSAIDARRAGFEAIVIEDACRGIDISGSLEAAWSAMGEVGVVRMASETLRA